MQLQHGDVCIWSTKIPKEAKNKKGKALAEGEATGHAHTLTGKRGEDYQLLEMGDRLFARILNGNVEVIHQEHKPIAIPPGDYEVSQVYEYDHAVEEAKRVVD